MPLAELSSERENELNCLNWPYQSPDLNIIENVWRTIKIKLQNSKCDILNKQILVREVNKIWVGLLQFIFRACITQFQGEFKV